MSLLPNVMVGEIGLLIGPHAEEEMMLELTAMLAEREPVRVLDSSGQFDVRRCAPRRRETLHQISVVRAFTCYQMAALLAETAVSPTPFLVFDLLAAFDDESVSIAECYRLLRIVVSHLQRLRQQAPVIVSIRPPHQPARTGLVKLVADEADQVFINRTPL